MWKMGLATPESLLHLSPTPRGKLGRKMAKPLPRLPHGEQTRHPEQSVLLPEAPVVARPLEQEQEQEQDRHPESLVTLSLAATQGDHVGHT